MKMKGRETARGQNAEELQLKRFWLSAERGSTLRRAAFLDQESGSWGTDLRIYY